MIDSRCVTISSFGCCKSDRAWGSCSRNSELRKCTMQLLFELRSIWLRKGRKTYETRREGNSGVCGDQGQKEQWIETNEQEVAEDGKCRVEDLARWIFPLNWGEQIWDSSPSEIVLRKLMWIVSFWFTLLIYSFVSVWEAIF